MIENRIEQLQYKGEVFKIGTPATEDEISALKKELRVFFPETCLDFEKVTKHGMMKHEHFKDFYNKHVKETQYYFQIRKCSDLGCSYHESIPLDADKFEKNQMAPNATGIWS